MNTISHERLIELAEGYEKPTADELHLIKSDVRLQAELEELRALFHDLRAQPEPELKPQAIAGILPGVRTKIRERSEHNVLSGLFSWQPVGNAVALVASLLVLLGLLLYLPSTISLNAEQKTAVYGFASLEVADPALDAGILQFQAENTGDFELFDSIENNVDSTESIELLDENTFDLMDRAADLEDERFKEIKDSFAAVF